MKIKHIELLSESLDRRVQLTDSGSLAAFVSEKYFTVFDYIDGNQAWLKTSPYYIDDNVTSTNNFWSANKINSEIGAANIGLQSSIHEPVQNLTELKALASGTLSDKEFIMVEDKGLYRYDANTDVSTDTGDSVINPDPPTTGSWYRISLSSDLYLKKPNTAWTANNLLMLSGSAEQAGDSGIAAANVLQKGTNAANNTSVYFSVQPSSTPGTSISSSTWQPNSFAKRNTSANHTTGYVVVSGDGAANYASGSNILIQNLVTKSAGDLEDIAFFNADGGIKHLPGYNIHSFVSGTDEQSNEHVFAIYDSKNRVLKRSYISPSSIVTASLSTTTYVAGYDASRNAISQSNVEIQYLVTGSATPNQTGTDYFASYNGSTRQVSPTEYQLNDFVTRIDAVSNDTHPIATFDSGTGNLYQSTKKISDIVTASLDPQTYVAGFNYNNKAVSQSNVEIQYLVTHDEATILTDPTAYISVIQEVDGKKIYASKQLGTYVNAATNVNDVFYIATYSASSAGDAKIHPSSKKVTDFLYAGNIPLYTITLMRSNISVGAGSNTIDMYDGDILPYPVDKSRMLSVSVAGIVYASSSDSTPLNEQYYISTLNDSTFTLIISASYSIESEETVLVSYLSYTSSL